jgi:GAF domain-containing protein
MDQKPRSASDVASGPARTLRLSKASFDALHGQGGVAGISVLFAMIRTSSERIRRLSAQLVVYDEIGKTIGEAPDLQGLLDVVLRQMAGAAQADWGLLVLRSPYSDQLDPRSQFGLELTREQREAVAAGQGFLQLALARSDARLIADLEREEPAKDCPRLGFETPSLLLAPITLATECLGLLILGGRQIDQFDLDALHLAKGVARQTAQAILHARHREEEQARSRHARQYVRF